MFCSWLVAYCKDRDNVNDLLEILYKQPYIEMYEDIRNGIIEGDFSVEQITIFLEETSDLLFRDCKDCKNSEEIRVVAFATRAGTYRIIIISPVQPNSKLENFFRNVRLFYLSGLFGSDRSSGSHSVCLSVCLTVFFTAQTCCQKFRKH